ncbi:MAG: hypothetical protein ACOX3G_11245 [Armatimonadota bacterium]|jgi:tetratricopeptide (TPR) repeat protein
MLLPFYFVGILLAAVGIFVAMHWWAEGALAGSEAIVLAIVFGGLVFGLFVAQNLLQLLFAAVPLLAAFGYAIYTWQYGSWRTYYKRRCANYENIIRSDPRNLAAREFLADSLYALGDLDRAVDELQAAVDLGGDTQCQYKLGKWSKELHLRNTVNPVCRWCGTENNLNERKCYKCGSDLPYDSPFSAWLMGGRSERSRYYLLVITAVSVVVVSWLLLGIRFAIIPLILCVAALAGWSLLKSSRS